MHININSILGPEKYHGVEVILESGLLDMVIIQETNLGPDDSDSHFNYSSYQIIRRDRCAGAGGMLLFIKKDYVITYEF